MKQRSKVIASLFATLFVGAALTQSASCTLSETGGLPPNTQRACATAVDCEDSNPCTTEICNDQNVCVYTPEPNGPLDMQVAGDCVRTDCNNGAPSVVQDPADIPDDNEPCTTDSCDSGMPSNTPIADDSQCQRGNQSGTCQMGVCKIVCNAQMPCDDLNPCTTDTCDSGTSTCVFTNIDGSPTPGATQTVGDCKVQLCLGGKDTPVNDDADVPDDGNSCTDDLCNAGVPSNVGTASGTYCMSGSPDVCDGTGKCVECTLPVHCVGIVETDCIKRDCDLATNTCKPKYLGNETTAFAQVTGDCQRNVCNGTDGGTVSVPDDADKPDDTNACTTDTCSNGTKVFTPVAQGTGCGSPKVCNAGGQCVGCNMPSDCQGTDDFCKQRTCVNNVCGVSYTANNTALPAANQTSMDCKVVVCDGAGNTKINADTNDLPPSDNNQCTQDSCSAQGNPVYPNLPTNTVCSQNGGDVCNGNGACKKSNGKNCAAGGECISSNCIDAVCCNNTCGSTCKACNVAGSLGTCTNVPKYSDDSPSCINASTCDGAGACKKEDGQGCAADGDCVNGNCVDGICCESSCTGQCKACNVTGNLGKCVNAPSGVADTNSMPQCTGGSLCDGAGNCKKADGQGCTVNGDCLNSFCVDNICCENACTTSCKACNVAGNLGKCANLPSGQDDTNASMACSGLDSCDGMGNCKGDQGQTCTMAGQCLNNTCVDGYCCENACSGTCKSCGLTGNNGKCMNIPSGQDDTNASTTCIGDQSCDGAGVCKGELGATCTMAGQCLSGNCNDGVCCDSACTGTCKVCNAAGACVNVASGMDDANASTTCTGSNQSCDGMGNCKKIDGESCGGAGECESGFCADGVCCNEACTGACVVCSAAGVCGNVASGMDDPNGMPACSGSTQSCNGAGACKLEAGENCNAGSDCLSGMCTGNPKKCT